MKKPSLLLILSAGHSLIWSAGVFAVLQFLSMTSGGVHGAGFVWSVTAGTFAFIFAAHLAIGRLLRKRMGADAIYAREKNEAEQ